MILSTYVNFFFWPSDPCFAQMKSRQKDYNAHLLAPNIISPHFDPQDILKISNN